MLCFVISRHNPEELNKQDAMLLFAFQIGGRYCHLERTRVSKVHPMEHFFAEYSLASGNLNGNERQSKAKQLRNEFEKLKLENEKLKAELERVGLQKCDSGTSEQHSRTSSSHSTVYIDTVPSNFSIPTILTESTKYTNTSAAFVRAKLVATENELQQANRKLEALNLKTKSLERKLEEFKVSCSGSNSEISKLRSKLREYESSGLKPETSHSRNLSVSKPTKTEIQTEKRWNSSEIVSQLKIRLNDELKLHSIALKKAQDDGYEATTRLNESDTRCIELESKIRNFENLNIHLNEKLLLVEKSLKEYQALNNELVSKNNTLQRSVETLESEISSLKQATEQLNFEKGEEIESLNDSVRDLQDTLENCRITAEKNEKMQSWFIVNMKADIEDLEIEIDILKLELKTSELSVEDLMYENNVYHSQIQILRTSNSNYNHEIKNLKLTVLNLEHRLEEEMDRNNHMQILLNELDHDMNLLRNHATNLNLLVSEYQEELYKAHANENESKEMSGILSIAQSKLKEYEKKFDCSEWNLELKRQRTRPEGEQIRSTKTVRVLSFDLERKTSKKVLEVVSETF